MIDSTSAGYFRSRFRLPQHDGKDAVYFLGNSLGLQPLHTATAIQAVLQQWAGLGVEAFFKGDQPWLDVHGRLQPRLARLVGARPAEVVAMNQLTVNIHLLLTSFYQPWGKRNKIICEAGAFPSDQYSLYSHIKQRGFSPDDVLIEVKPRKGEVLILQEDILAAIHDNREELALVFWGGVNYYTGQLFDIQQITKAAQSAGAKAGFDLAHAAGNVPLQLHDWGVDFAAWCSYKYLNAGPGGIGCAFIHERYHNDKHLNRLAGWWGNQRSSRFQMDKTFVPDPSAEGWQLSTPSPLLYASLAASLALFEEAGMQTVFAKNRELNAVLWSELKKLQQQFPVEVLRLLTPEGEAEKGCQVSMAVRQGRKVFNALSAEGIFADWREPEVIRVAPVAFYNTAEEVRRFAEVLQTALVTFAA